MFAVRYSPCSAPNLQTGPPPHAVCTAIARRLPPPPGPQLSPHRVCPPFYSRQGAAAFNQPLSFDTSSVTNMGYMFQVRSSPSPAPNLQSSPRLHAACAPRSPAALPPPDPAPLPTSYALLSTRQGANSLSDANKLLIRCAWAGNSAFASAGYGPSWGPGTCPATFTSTATLKTAVQAYSVDLAAAIATYGLMADWDVSAITDTSYLFKDLKDFNADVSNWDTSGVTSMRQMFYGASAFNQPLGFDTSSVKDMQSMFNAAISLSAANKLLIRC
eukprot:scaffold79087_cov69-Phaeocystis_antarctica.AAC.1